jgi:Na+/H+ antiporter NhaC
MNNRPPRDGARWGADPAPEPVPLPPVHVPPAAYVELCNAYGQQNADKAIVIFHRTKNDYPHLKTHVLSNGEFHFASWLLSRATFSIAEAAKDGRAHTMPETLDILEKHVGKFLAETNNESTIDTMILGYGDEAKGIKGKKASEEAENKKTFWQIAVIVAIPSLFMGWMAETQRGGYDFFGAFSTTAVVVFCGIMVLGIIGKIFE